MLNEKMKSDLINLGLKSSDVILMHSSLYSLGFVEGGAKTVIDTLLSVLYDGTLLLPALSYGSVNAENPVFNIKTTPSCVGAISEYFRTRTGVKRSLHPTHSVCGAGKYADEILSKHGMDDTPAGANSPFALLPEFDGKVLMLGCGLGPNTSIHAIEETAKPWYLLKDKPTGFTLMDESRNLTVKKYYCHNFHGSRVAQKYERLADIMDIKKGNVLNAQCYLIDAKEMWQKAVEKLKKSEEYFVERY